MSVFAHALATHGIDLLALLLLAFGCLAGLGDRRDDDASAKLERRLAMLLPAAASYALWNTASDPLRAGQHWLPAAIAMLGLRAVLGAIVRTGVPTLPTPTAVTLAGLGLACLPQLLLR